MFDRVSQLAEEAANNVSRRQFFGRFGGTALAAAAAMGGFLAFPGDAIAGRQCRSDSDCPSGKVCRSGHCVDPPRACDPMTSSLSCQGVDVGTGCIDGDFTGICVAAKGSDSCSCGELKPKKH